MKIEVDLKGVTGNEEIIKAVVEKIKMEPQIKDLDKIIDQIIHDYIVQRVLSKLEYTISGEEIKRTYKEICQNKVNEFCDSAFEKDKEDLEKETAKITDLVSDKMVEIFINSMFNMFTSKIQQQEWDMRWGVINQIKMDIRNGNM